MTIMAKPELNTPDLACMFRHNLQCRSGQCPNYDRNLFEELVDRGDAGLGEYTFEPEDAETGRMLSLLLPNWEKMRLYSLSETRFSPDPTTREQYEKCLWTQKYGDIFIRQE